MNKPITQNTQHYLQKKVLQKKKKEDRAEVLEQVAERVRALPYWRRRGGGKKSNM